MRQTQVTPELLRRVEAAFPNAVANSPQSPQAYVRQVGQQEVIDYLWLLLREQTTEGEYDVLRGSIPKYPRAGPPSPAATIASGGPGGVWSESEEEGQGEFHFGS